MALLSMCLQEGWSVAAAHVNYHHRPEAEEEEAYVRSFCRAHGVPLHVLNAPFAWTGNFEAAARDWRYSFFVQTVRENGYAGILIGHQEDDLLETWLMQKERNLVPAWYGLRERMEYQGVPVVRPLLGFTKRQLQDWCEQNGIRYYLDATNESLDYARNRMRHEVVSALNAGERRAMRAEIDAANAGLSALRKEAAGHLTPQGVQLAEYRALGKPERLILLRKLCGPQAGAGLRLAFLEEADRVILDHSDFILPVRERILVPDGGMLTLREPPAPYEYVLADLEAVRRLGDQEWFSIRPGSPGVFAVSVSPEDFPLAIRSPRAGDAIEMRFGRKRLNRFFIDRRIPRWQRAVWPVVANRAGQVILVPGLGCDCQHFSMMPDFNVLQYGV